MDDKWQDGLHGAGTSLEVSGAVFPKQELYLGSSADLASLTREMELFTPALAYVFGGMTDMVWFDLSAELGHDLPLFYWTSPRPLLGGLELGDGDAAWNHALWATYRMYWPLLCDFLLSVLFHDRRRGTACGFGLQQLRLGDPFRGLLAAGAEPATLHASSFGINGSDRCVAFAPVDARLGLPTARRLDPDERMRKVAGALRNADGVSVAGVADVKGGHVEQ